MSIDKSFRNDISLILNTRIDILRIIISNFKILSSCYMITQKQEAWLNNITQSIIIKNIPSMLVV